MFENAKSFMRKLCGDAWVNSEAPNSAMFKGSSGSIPVSRSVYREVCGTRPKVHRRPLPDRELIRHTPATVDSAITPGNKMTCPKCGTFGKSGRTSCCAPGGAWFKKCGGAGNKKVEHKWSEGVEACRKPTTTPANAVSFACPKCATIKKSGKTSCCARGGSWYRNCGSGGNSKFGHTWSEGIRACKKRKTAIDQRLHAPQQLNTSTGAGVTPSSVSINTLTTTSDSTSTKYVSTFTSALCVFFIVGSALY